MEGDQAPRAAIRRAIEWLQPYNTRNDRYRELRPALADIHDLNNIDKHRQLHLTTFNGGGYGLW